MAREAQRVAGIASRGFSLFLKNLGVRELCLAEDSQEAFSKCSHILDRDDVALVIVQKSLYSRELENRVGERKDLLVVVMPESLAELREDPALTYEELLRKVLGFKVRLVY
ncbi:MAG: hypothetical protein QXS85_01885 [Acidilobaceae archaeon]